VPDNPHGLASRRACDAEAGACDVGQDVPPDRVLSRPWAKWLADHLQRTNRTFLIRDENGAAAKR